MAAVVGELGSTVSFNTLFVPVPETFPTLTRSTATGLCSTSARVGGLGSGLRGWVRMPGGAAYFGIGLRGLLVGT